MNEKQITACILAGLLLVGALVLIPRVLTPPLPEGTLAPTERQARELLASPDSDPAAAPNLIANRMLTNGSNFDGANGLNVPLAALLLETNRLKPVNFETIGLDSYILPDTPDPKGPSNRSSVLPR